MARHDHCVNIRGLKNRLLPVVVGMVLLLGGGSVWALDANDLSFYAPFDGSLEAVVSVGDPKPAMTGQYQFVPGLLENALLAGEKEKSLSYVVRNNISERQGAISMWVKPLWTDWATEHNFITIPDNRMSIWYSRNFCVCLTTPLWQLADYPCPFPDTKGAEFHHIVITWGGGKSIRYADGKYQAQMTDLTGKLPPWDVNNSRFEIGKPITSDDRMALDELMVFNRPLDATEAKNMYRHMTAPLLETIASIGEVVNAPKMDGVFSPMEWSRTAQMTDFVDRPFGNLSSKLVKANIGYDQKALYLAVRSPEGNNKISRENSLEVRILVNGAKEPCHFVVTADRKLFVYRGSSVAQEEVLWQAAVSTFTGKESAESCFEVAIPWSSIGLSSPPEGTLLKMNILRRWSAAYGDFASWADVAPAGISTNPTAIYGTIILGGKSPVLAMDSLGKLNYARLELTGRIISPSGTDQTLKAEVRLQPSDLKEYYDPKTLPGTRSYTGTQVILDRDVKTNGVATDLHVTGSFSDTDINSFWLKVSDPAGKIIYQSQRPFVAQPPVIVSARTFPSHDRLEVTADVSHYRESSLETLRAEIQVIAPTGKVVKTARIDKFASGQEIINLPLASLPIGTITVKTALLKDKTKISDFTTSFDKIAPGPWCGNNLGKDDIVIPPFTVIKVEGQAVRTYTWDNSLFPIRITSSGEEMLAAPMELVAGAIATGKSNPARVTIKEQKDTRAVMECTGEIGGVPVVAEHTIEYDGMCLTRIQLQPQAGTRLKGLSLCIPYRRGQSTTYMTSPWESPTGAVREKVNGLQPTTGSEKTFPFKNTCWLGNEDRGMTWFAEDARGWKLKNNPSPLKIVLGETTTSFILQFAGAPLDMDKPLALTFGIIATPVKPMRENWRFMCFNRDWQLQRNLTVSNNDIVNPVPGFKDYLAKIHQTIPVFVPYQMPCWINTRQPESKYFLEEWLTPPLAIQGSDAMDLPGVDSGAEKHFPVCLGSGWQDFMVYYAVKAFKDLSLDGYYFDGAKPGDRGCTNTVHGHGWLDEDGNVQGTYPILAYREFYKRLAVEFYKTGRPYLIVGHTSWCVEMPLFSFLGMGFSGEQFSTTATRAGDYNKLISLSYFRTQFTGQQFGLPIQWIGQFWENIPDCPPAGKEAMDSMLEFSLVHGVGDNITGALGNKNSAENGRYIRRVLDAQESFGVRKKDCTFLPYWKNAKQVTVEPADENLVCSIWQRPGKILLILANSTKEEQKAKIRLNPAELGLEGALKAHDLISKENLTISAGVVTANVAHSGWRLIVVEGANAAL